MTNLELHELVKALNIHSLKEQNMYQVGDITYAFKKDKVIVSGKIPVSVIQELSMLPRDKNNFLELLLSLDKRDGKFFKKVELYTVEEFILFFEYMDDYTLNKRGLDSNSKEMCDDVIGEVLEKISEQVDLQCPHNHDRHEQGNLCLLPNGT